MGTTAKRSVKVSLEVLAVVLLVGIGVVIGVLVKGGEDHTASEALAAKEIGSVSEGRELFVEYGCAACHSYKGKGGSDAPALDFMKGRMSAADIADMSGRIWNHLPAMEIFFKEENIPFPTFKGHQMADLIAYLHGGGPAPDVSKMEMGEHGDEEKGEKGEESKPHGHGEEEKGGKEGMMEQEGKT